MSPDRALPALLLAAVVAVTAVSTAGLVTGAQPSISNVTVSPQEPRTGELVRFTTTIRNAEGASGSFMVTQVWIREAGTTRDYARVRDVGNVPPGSSLEVPLTTRFDGQGVKDLRVHVNVRDENNDDTQLQYPVTVVVSDRNTQLSIDAEDAAVGATTEVNVTVSNGGADPIRQLDLRIGGDGVDARNARRLLARLEPGADHTFSFDVTFAEAGETSIEAALQFAGTSGQTQTVRQAETVQVEGLREDVGVTARVPEGGGANPPLAVEVSNFGNAPLEDVSVVVRDGDRSVARRTVADVQAGSSREVAVNLSGVENADLDVIAAYETGGRAGEASTSVSYSSRPGRIELTGLDYSQEGGVTTISGSASNVGLSEVNSVVLRVLPAEGVEPVAPNREYFVGTVPASDFVSFDLTARIAGNVSSVPIQVTYLTEGGERSESVSVPYESSGAATPAEPQGGGMGLLPILIGVVVVAAIGAVVYVGWRNRGGE